MVRLIQHPPKPADTIVIDNFNGGLLKPMAADTVCSEIAPWIGRIVGEVLGNPIAYPDRVGLRESCDFPCMPHCAIRGKVRANNADRETIHTNGYARNERQAPTQFKRCHLIAATLHPAFLLAITILSLFVTPAFAEYPGTNAPTKFRRGDGSWAVPSGGVSHPLSMVLNGAISVGNTAFTVDGTPPAGFTTDAIAVAVDPFTANCEVRAVNSVSGSTFTINSQYLIAHSSGASVLFLPSFDISPVLYGAKGDGTTDDWMAIQRGIHEATAIGGRLFGGSDIESRSWIFKQPLYFGESRMLEMRFLAHLTWPTNLQQAAITNVWAVMKHAREHTTISGYADTNTIIYAGGQGFTAGKLVAFNNFYNETLPTPLVSGRLYQIKAIDDAAGWMTLQEVNDTAEIDLTANGTGWVWGNMLSNTRIKWEKVRLTLRGTNLNGVYVVAQQQSFTRDLRVDMEGRTTPATLTNYGVQIVGQISPHYNLEVDPSYSNQVPVRIEGIGNWIDLLTVNGEGACAIEFMNGRVNGVGWLLAEQTHGPGVLLRGNPQGIRIGFGYWSAPNTNTAFVRDDTSGNSSYELGPVMGPSANLQIVADVYRGYTNKFWDGSATSGFGDSDNNAVYPGHYQMQGLSGPHLNARRSQTGINDNRGFRHIDESIWFDSSSASRTGTLSSATGWRGLMQMAGKTASANSVYISPIPTTVFVTITSPPLGGSGTNITVNAVTREWTNATTSTTIETNSTVNNSATNLHAAWVSFPQSGVEVQMAGTNSVAFKGLGLTLGIAGGWASLQTNAGQTINGAASMVQLTNQYQAIRFSSDGATNWRIVTDGDD